MPRAAGDAERIYYRIVRSAPMAAHDWYNRLIVTLESLAQFPERCGAVDELSRSGRKVRKLLFGRKPHTYRVYFDVVGATVRILHIRHGARREPKRV